MSDAEAALVALDARLDAIDAQLAVTRARLDAIDAGVALERVADQLRLMGVTEGDDERLREMFAPPVNGASDEVNARAMRSTRES